MKIIYGFVFLTFIYPILMFGQIVSYDSENFYVNTDNYDLVIQKESGMITSAKVNNINFELVCDYPNYSLFFPEFIPEDTLTTSNNYDFFIPPRWATEFTGSIEINTDLIAIINFVWNTEYIKTTWRYKFINNKPFFQVDIARTVNKSYVYSNAQQCVMFNADFDDTYIVDYTGNLHCTMSDNIYTYPSSATFQHSMFSAIDEGLTNIYPMIGWHDDEYDIIAGTISTYVSPNQRKTISYHGGGSSNQHPGFSEGQWNWFGKSDSESLFLKEGLSYGMTLYYFLDSGNIGDLLEFNQNLFNENYYDSKEYENYFAASFGGRSCPLEHYFWRFPQASSDYICSQELFRHRSFAMPCSQNGTRDTHIFNLYVKQNSLDNCYDLTPIYGTELLFEEAETIIGTDYMVGSMSWIVNSLEHKLNYKVFEGSDKVQVSGEISVLEETSIKDLFVELELSPRVSEVVSIGDSIYDIRCYDEVYDQIGITAYNIQNIEDIIVNNDHIRFYLVKNLSDSLYYGGNSFEYSFSLFPHIGFSVETYDDITPLISAPENHYREYFLTFPDQLGENSYGICNNPDIFPYKSVIGNDSLIFSLKVYCNQGNYPIEILIDTPLIKTVFVNNEEFLTWEYNESTNILTLENDWEEGDYSIEIFDKDGNEDSDTLNKTFSIFPNPFVNGTNIYLNFLQETKYIVKIYNIKGQLVNNFEGVSAKKTLYWNGKNNHNISVASGIYFCELITDSFKRSKKILLLK